MDDESLSYCYSCCRLSICTAAGIVAVAAEVLGTGCSAEVVRTVKEPKAAVSVSGAIAAGYTKLERHKSAEIAAKGLARIAGCTLSRHYMETAVLEAAEAHLAADCSLTDS